MASNHGPQELTAQQLELHIDTTQLQFTTTDDLQPLVDIIGQERALHALELGLGIRDRGYNIYVSGEKGIGKRTLIDRMVKQRQRHEPTPSDWVYVNNFDEPDRPLAISLIPGNGRALKRDMEKVMEHFKDEVPRAFRQEDFSRERQRITQEYQRKGREAFTQLEQLADEMGFIIQQTPDSQIMMAPKIGDRPMNGEEFERLTSAEKEDLTLRQQELGRRASTLFAQQREIERQLRVDVREVERNFSARVFGPALEEIAAKYNTEKLTVWIHRLKDDLIDNVQRFQESTDGSQRQFAAMMGVSMPSEADVLREYQVNVIIDNSQTKGAPVICEGSPNYKNLFGTIPGTTDRLGRMTTDFTHIKAGSLHRANGGYLILDLLEAIIEPLVWKELKRTIQTGVIEYHMYDPFGVFATSSLRPEPIPLTVKLVVVGNPLLYYMLSAYDEDFKEIFKVKADFDTEIPGDDTNSRTLACFIRKITDGNAVLPFTPDGIKELSWTAARLAGNREKMTAEFRRLSDIARESTYWAKQNKATAVSDLHVRRAVDEQVFRSNLIEEKIRELINNGSIIISVDGARAGQVNGLAIAQLGDYAFGRPSRVSAAVGLGTSGIINIERESRLSGRTYDKAMLIIEGYLRNKYATHHPLALSASIAMEQSYGLIEGDSASVAELVCLLSALANIPLRQDIAITGSINQWGEVQVIGGATQKVEGFFDTCKQIGLTGKQGVALPASNIRNLVLRHDVVEAVRENRFHIWALTSVDEALELLSGRDAGDIDQDTTFHGKVDQRLRAMLDALKEQRIAGMQHEPLAMAMPWASQEDPRPPMPGRSHAT